MQDQDKKRYDIIICGSGPAGSTCALALANSGLRVAVIEKHNYPRDKVCGDAVAAYVPKVLHTINPAFSAAFKNFEEKVIVNTCRIVAPNQKIIDLSYRQHGFIAKRYALDNFLYELAASQPNITYFLNHTITDAVIHPAEGIVTIKANDRVFTSRLIVGCDGAQSVINKKTTATKPDLNHYSGAVRAYFKNVSGIPENTFELHFIKGLLPGYFWIFPVKDNMANVGLGALSATISRRKMNLRNMLQSIIHDVPYISKRFVHAEMLGKIEGFGLPLGSRKVTISGDHFMLCGDAASLIDPLSGEGIGQAIVSGRYAGWQAKKCFEANNFSAAFMKQYDKQVYDKFWSHHRKNYFIQKLIANGDWLLNGVADFSTRSKWVRSLVQKVME
jgi:menaquinone-9 beta-reductase